MATNRFVRPLQVRPISQYVDNSLAFNELSQTADLRQARIDAGVETAGEVTALINAVTYDPNDSQRAAEVQTKYKDGIDKILSSGIDPGSSEFSRKVIDLQNQFATDTEVRALKFNAEEQAKYDAFVAENPNAFIPKHLKEQFTTPNQRDAKGNVKVRRWEGGIPDPDLDTDLTNKFSSVKASIREYEEGNPDNRISFQIAPDGTVKTLVNNVVQEKGNAFQIGKEYEAQVSRLLDAGTFDESGRWLQGQIANRTWTRQDALDYIANKAGAQTFKETGIKLGAVTGSSGGSGSDPQGNTTVVDPNGITIVSNLTTPTKFNTDFYQTDNEGNPEYDDNGNVKTVGSDDKDEAFQELTANIEKSYSDFQADPSSVIAPLLEGKTPAEQQKIKTTVNNWINNNLESFDSPIASTQNGSKVFRTIDEITDDNLVRTDEYNDLYNTLETALYYDENGNKLAEPNPTVIHDQIVTINDRIHSLNSEIATRNQVAYAAEQAVFGDVPQVGVAVMSDDDKAVYNESKFKEEATVLNNKTMNEMVKGIQLFKGFPEESGVYNTTPENSFLNGNGKTRTVGNLLNSIQGIDFTKDFTGGRGEYAQKWAFEKINALGFDNPKQLLAAMRDATYTEDLYEDAPSLSVGMSEAGATARIKVGEKQHKVFEDVRERAANDKDGSSKEALQANMEKTKSDLLRKHIETRKGTDLAVFTTLDQYDPNMGDISFVNNMKLSPLGKMEANMAKNYGVRKGTNQDNSEFRKMMETDAITYTNGQPLSSDEDLYEDLLSSEATTEELGKAKSTAKGAETKFADRAGGIKHLGMVYDPNSGKYKGSGYLTNRFGDPVLKNGEAIQVLYDNPDKSFSNTINEMLGASGGEANFARMLDMQADVETELGKTTVTFKNDDLLPGTNATFSRRIEGGKSLYDVSWSIPEVQQRQLVDALQLRYPNESMTKERAQQLLGFNFEDRVESASKSELGQKLVSVHGALHAMQTQTLASEKGTVLPDDIATNFEPANLVTIGQFGDIDRSKGNSGLIRTDDAAFASGEDFPVINADLTDNIQNLVGTLGPVVITSAARTTQGNQDADGEDTSLHPYGRAMDIRTDSTRLNAAEREAIGKYRSLSNNSGLWSQFGIKYMEDEGDHIHIEFLDPNQ
jgi:hypothetical protein